MKRHTQEAPRYGHHERAGIAVKLECILRRAVKPVRLYWNAFQLRNARDHAEDMVSMAEAVPKYVRNAHHVVCQLEAERMRIERGL